MSVDLIIKYYNLAKKAGAVIFGADNILSKQNLYLIVLSDGLSNNAKKKIIDKFGSLRFAKIVFLAEIDFRRIEENKKIMAFAVNNINLANAMTN